MAFINEKLSNGQREEFAAKEIKNPLSPMLPILKPVYWTIDKDKEVYLFSIGSHRDYPYEEIFFYCWKDREIILPVKKENRSPNTRIWSLETELKQPLNEIEDKTILNELINELRQALMVHKIEGTPDLENMSVEVECNF